MCRAGLRSCIAVSYTHLFALNQLLWSMGVAAQTQCYSVRGLYVVSANNIVSALSSLIIVVANAVGNTARIVIGHMMGRSEAPDKIRSVYQKFIGLGFVSSFAVALLYALAGRYFPLIYNTTDEVRQLASSFILISALTVSYTHLPRAPDISRKPLPTQTRQPPRRWTSALAAS